MLANWKNIIAAAALLLTAGVSAEVVNGDFAKVNADGTPENWQCYRSGKRQDGISVDTEVGHSAKGALRLCSGNRMIGVTQDIKLKPKTEYRFSCRYKTSKCDPAPGRDVKRWGGGCALALLSVLPDGKTHWHFGIPRKYRGTTEWTPVEFRFNSSRLKSDVLRIVLNMTGTVPEGVCWFDDVKLEELGTPQAAQKAAPAPAPKAAAPKAAAPKVFAAVTNGDFARADADGAPEDWRCVRLSKGKDIIAIDREVFRSPKGSLRLRSATEVTQDIKLKPKTEYRFSCWYKTSKCDPAPGRDVKRWGGGCALALLSVLPDGKTHWHFGIARKYRGTADWTMVEFTFNSSRFKSDVLRIVLSMTGTAPDGVCWFDDVKLEELGGKKTVARFFPVDFQKGLFYIAENMPGIPRLGFTGDSKKLLKSGVLLRMELPKEFRLIGAVAERPNPDLPETDRNFLETVLAKEVTASGAASRVFELAVPRQMLRNLKKSGYNWGNDLYTAIAAEPGSRGKSGKALLTLHSEGKEIFRYPFVLYALDPVKLPEAPSTMLDTGISYPASQYGHMPEVNDAYRKFWCSLAELRSSHCKYINFYRTYRPDYYRSFFFMWTDYGHRHGTIPAPAALKLGRKKLAELPPVIDRNGHPIKGSVAPWYVAEDPDNLIWPAMRDMIKKALDAGGERITVIHNNFETNVDMGYDPENIRRFVKFAKLQKTPTREEIRSRYSELWRRYQLEVNAQIVRQYAKVVHENFPGRKFEVCNTLLKKGEKYPVDVDRRMFDDVVEQHAPMCFCSGTEFFDKVSYNLSIPGKPFFVDVDPTENHELFYYRYTPLEVGRDVVATAALGALGCRFYPQDNFDGRYLQYIADGFDTVRKLEKFYARRKPGKGVGLTPENIVTTRFNDDGREIAISFPDAESFIRQTLHEAEDGEKLLTVFNYSKKYRMIFRLTAAGGGSVHDPINSRNYPEADWKKGALVEVPAQGTGYFVISKKTPPAMKNTVTQAQLAKRLAEDKQQLAAANLYTAQRQGKAEISFARLPDTGSTPMMKMQSEHYRIYIDCMTGEVVGWKKLADAEDDILWAGKTRGFLGRPVWTDPLQDRKPPYAFRMVQSGFEADGSPWAEFVYTVPQFDNVETAVNPLLGLETVKRITLRDGGKRVSIRFAFTNKNEAKSIIPLEFRLNNAPLPGNRFLGAGRTAGRILEIGYTSPKGPEKLTAADPASMHLVRVPRRDPQKHPAEREWKYSPITVSANVDGMSETMTLRVPDQGIAGVYSWRGVTLCTVEPYSEKIPLKPGESKVFTIEYLR